jgi:hypothetical protein
MTFDDDCDAYEHALAMADVIRGDLVRAAMEDILRGEFDSFCVRLATQEGLVRLATIR